MSNASISHNRLKELVNYDPDTGVMTAILPRPHVKKGSALGCLNIQGYLQVQIDGKQYYVHRLAYFFMTGRWPAEIDHVNGIRNDNRWSNLRSISRFENAKNAALPSTNKSGVCGIYYRKDICKWRAQIMCNGQYIHLGYFDSKDEAAQSRKDAEERYKFTERHGQIA